MLPQRYLLHFLLFEWCDASVRGMAMSALPAYLSLAPLH